MYKMKRLHLFLKLKAGVVSLYAFIIAFIIGCCFYFVVETKQSEISLFVNIINVTLVGFLFVH